MTRSVETIFTAKVDGYLANVTRMKAATADMAKSGAANMKAHGADWDKIGKASTVAGLAIGAAVVYSAKKYMDFEAAMSKVGAVANSTAKEQKALGEAAIKAGQDTVFSAMQAAEAEAELLKAGISVSDVLGGALTGSLNLAAAGQIGLAQSAEIAAQAMNIFNLEGADVGHIADVLTAGANKSAAGVDDLGMALQQSGLVAKQTGLSMEDTVGVLSAFADNALKGSDAGTSLKTMLQRLTPQSAEAQAQFDKLGISAYDAQGNFVGLENFAGQLKSQLSGLTPEARNSALAVMFGSDAVRGANVLYEQGAEGIRKYVAAVDDQGAAARMAARQTDNLKGDLEQLKGTFESAFINAGSGSNGGLRSLVQSITGMVNGFNNLSPAAQSAAFQIAAVSAAALLVGGAGIKAVAGITAMNASLKTLGASSATAATALKVLGGAVAVAGVAMLATELGKIGPAAATADVGVRGLVSSVGQLSGTGRLTGGIADLFREDNGIFGSDEKWVSSGEAIERFAIRAQNAFGQDWESQVRRIQDFGASGAKMDETVRKIDGSLAELVRGGHADQAKAALDNLLKGISDPGVRAKTAEQFTAMQTALDETAVAAGKAGAEIDPLTGKTVDAGNAAQSAADDTKAWSDALNGLNAPLLDARSAARAFEESIDDASAALKKNGKSLDITKAKGRENQAALDGVAKAALDQISALQANGASQGQLQGKLSTSRSALIRTAEKFGMSKAAARAYADQVLQIPAARKTTITANVAGAKAGVEGVLRSLRSLPNGKTITVTTRYVTTGTRPTGGRSTRGGITKDADGGMHVRSGGALVKSYADGGYWDGTIGSAQPQIAKAGGRGINWAEEGAGPWEAFISGHPAKKVRSRGIAEDTVDRLGGAITWVKPMADGGTMTRSMADQVRGLSPRAAGSGGVTVVNRFDVRIDGALDPVAVGAQVERVLQDYTSVTGRPLQVVTR